MNDVLITELDDALNIDCWIDRDEVLEIAKNNGGKLEFQVKGVVRYETKPGLDAVRSYRLTVVG